MKYPQFFLLLCALILCANFGFQPNNSSPELPPLNFYGTIIARNGESFPFAYLTISGLYKSIAWYAKTTSPEENPHNNTTRLDLSQIENITVHHEKPLIKYKHRNFLTTSIQLINEKEPLTLLVETNRKIICKQITPTGKKLSKELTFDAINKIIIQGRQSSQNRTEQTSPMSEDRKVTEIKKIVHFND